MAEPTVARDVGVHEASTLSVGRTADRVNIRLLHDECLLKPAAARHVAQLLLRMAREIDGR